MDSIISHLVSFIVGLAGGSLLTLQFKKNVTASGKSRIVDQSGAHAGRDIVGGNKNK
ncbi:MAG: hypothetical protein PHD48_00725 [Alphaproteobacteria bacterium]|nr:hypothetical protein [Alphaproteobacteria bacterium]